MCPPLPDQRTITTEKNTAGRPSFAVLVSCSAGSATPPRLCWAAGSPRGCAPRAPRHATRAAWQRGRHARCALALSSPARGARRRPPWRPARPATACRGAGRALAWGPRPTLAAGARARPRAPRAAPAAAWAAWAARRARRPCARACPAARRSASGTGTGMSTTGPAPHAVQG
jgi:hypothetical protein